MSSDRDMVENWNRIRNKLLSCDETTQQLARQLNLNCETLLKVLLFRGDAFQQSLFAEHFNVDSEKHFVSTVEGMGLKINVDDWIKFIEYLRYSIRSSYQQPTASHAEQDAARALELEDNPHHHRGMPIQSNVYGSEPHEKVQQLLNPVLSNIFANGGGVEGHSYYAQYCNWLIGNVLHEPPNFTLEQLNEIYGVNATAMLPVHNLQTTFQKVYPKLDFEVAFGNACIAYLKCDHAVRNQIENYFITISPELNAFVEQFNTFEQHDVYLMWKRVFMIAQLMYSWTQIDHYDRSGVYADAANTLGSKSPRGGKSKRSNRSNFKRSKRSDSKRSKRSNSKRSNSKRSNSKRSNSKRSNSKRSNSKRSDCRSSRL